jgi:hypothetical protein
MLPEKSGPWEVAISARAFYEEYNNNGPIILIFIQNINIIL